MPLLDLIEVTLDHPGGTPPSAGQEVVVRGQRYHVLHVRPPNVRGSRRRAQSVEGAAAPWRLLVRKMPYTRIDGAPHPVTSAHGDFCAVGIGPATLAAEG